MYDEQETAFIIKQTAKAKNITIKQLLENCNLSINTVSELSKGKRMSYISFAKIADALDCSMDYLMGRTDNPTVSGNNISNFDTTINGTQANIIQGAETDLDEIKVALSKLTSSNRHRAIADMLDLLEKYIEK
nr:MAG: helix-turn-helix domain protein [Bacteriophage sp.]